MKKTLSFLLSLFLILPFSQAQKLKKTQKQVVADLQQHIGFLADDKLEGRRVGTEGEKKAMDYIAGQFELLGLVPKGDEGFIQPFEIYDGKMINPASHLIINGYDMKAGKEFFPLAFSANASVEAYPAISLQEEAMPWFMNLKEALEANQDNPHFDINDFIMTTATDMKAKGATALILYNLGDKEDGLAFDPKDRNEALAIPVVYVGKTMAKKYFSDETASLDLKLKTEIGKKYRTGHNVVALLDNGASSTVVLGAHFDHLGYGEDGNSMVRSGPRQIHNGADDNASGTAALLELAKLLRESKTKNTNFLFIAFSGEELGLNGSKYFADHPTIDLSKVNYMINMDMVGRLSDSSKVVTVGGYGTSPAWSQLVTTDKKTPFIIKTDSSGTGPSDHTSFYRKDIPVLFFFTGLHSDYHKPSDDADKINYVGEMQIVEYIVSLVERAAKMDQKPAFTKTRETQTTTSARFSVTLGVMPDYTYAGTGLRLDGISEGKAAQKAGLLTGDVVIGLGDYSVTSVETYMQALSKFKKGDSTVVKYKRGEEVKEAMVRF